MICGKCAREQKLSLEERKQLADELQEGKNECKCGKVLVIENGRLLTN